jgi:hypothetical protein
MNDALHSISPRRDPLLNSASEFENEALHERLMDARGRHRQCEYEVCVLLCEMNRRRAFGEFESVSIREYAQKHLGLKTRRCTELLALGRRLETLPELTEAFSAGQLGWTKAREVARVATPRTEGEWVRRALALTNRKLEREVAQCEPGDDPPDYDDAKPLMPARIRLRFDVDSTDALVLRRAMSLVRAQLGDVDADDGAVLAEVARRVLAEMEADQAQASAAKPVSERTPSAERVRIVIQECPTCSRQTHVGNDDVEREVSFELSETVDCDHERMEIEGPKAGHISRSVPPSVRRLALHRANYQCEVPGCTCHLYLDMHHLRRRADGGDHSLQNVAVACPAHHGAVHDGRLRLWREADGRLQVEWIQMSVPPSDEWFSSLLDVLQWEEMTTEDAADFLRVSPARAKVLLEHAERSCDVVRTVDDLWCRHGALAAELGEVPVAWV